MKLFLLLALLNFLFSVSSLPVDNFVNRGPGPSPRRPGPYSRRRGSSSKTRPESPMLLHPGPPSKFGHINYLPFIGKNGDKWRDAVVLKMNDSPQIITIPLRRSYKSHNTDSGEQLGLDQVIQTLFFEGSKPDALFPYIVKKLYRFDAEPHITENHFKRPLVDKVLIPMLIYVMRERFSILDNKDSRYITDSPSQTSQTVSVRMQLINSISAAYPENPEIQKVVEEQREHEKQWEMIKIGTLIHFSNPNGDPPRLAVVLAIELRSIIVLPFFHQDEIIFGGEDTNGRFPGLYAALVNLSNGPPFSYLGQSMHLINFDREGNLVALSADPALPELGRFTKDVVHPLLKYVIEEQKFSIINAHGEDVSKGYYEPSSSPFARAVRSLTGEI